MTSLCRVLIAALAALAAAGAAAQEKPAEQVLPSVEQYCSKCHAWPPPDALPKSSWPAVVRTMVEIHQERFGRAGLSEQQMKDITAFYLGSSPEKLPELPHDEALTPERAFKRRELGVYSLLPFITNVGVADLGNSGTGFLVCDGEAKELRLLARDGRKWREIRIGAVEVPVHTQVVDIDADGDNDVLVADLGQLPPLADRVGKLILMRQAAAGKFTRELLMEGLGRVSDARAVDLDGDRDLDIAVAVFGGGAVGEVFWLEDSGQGPIAGRYRRHDLSDLPGAVNVVPADLDGDGKTDLVSLVAQEHEMVMAFLNRGGGQFESGVLARAPHPMYGSTSLSVADMDLDRDLDVLFTNGDAFDAQTDPKPYHGVQWLENKGQMRFEYHSIGRLYGAATASAGDLDGDGDIDVVAGSWVSNWLDPRRYAVVWYENDGNQNFAARGIASRPAGISSLVLADVNGDGSLDIVAGAIRMDLLLAKFGSPYRASRLFPPSAPSSLHPRLVVFENPRTSASLPLPK